MGIRIGGINPIKLSEAIISVLMQKGIITKAEADAIVAHSKQ